MIEWFLLFLFVILAYIFSTLEEVLLQTNTAQFQHFYKPTALFFKISIRILDRQANYMQSVWVHKIFFTIASCFVLMVFAYGNDGFVYHENESIFKWSVVFILASALILLEWFPKILGGLIPNQFLYIVSPLIFSLQPLSLLILKFLQMFRIRIDSITSRDSNLNTFLIKQKLQQFLSQHHIEGKSIKKNLEIISNIFDLRETTAREVMIPRTEIAAIEKRSTISDAIKKFKQTQLSKIIVFDTTVDDIVGYIQLDDLFKKPKKISTITKDVFFVPESRKILDLFQDFLKSQFLLAVVVDEYGGTAGIISLPDLVEELTGDIKNDMGRSRKKNEPISYWKTIEPEKYEVNAKMKTEDMYKELNIDLIGDEYETIAGFVLHHLERFPVENECFDFKEYKITIVSILKKQIQTILIEKKPQ